LFTTVKSFHTSYVGLTDRMGRMRETRGISMASTETTTKTEAPKTPEMTKDTGRVRVGGGTMHFSDPSPAREATKDSGRVRVGGGTIHY
jgi:hypothetical protein